LISHTEGRTYPDSVQEWVLRRIFGSKREEVIGGSIKLHNEELYNIQTSLHII
jgi:hypothetical protein